MAGKKIIIDEEGKENWETYQADVALMPMKDCIQIRFTKKTADAVNIYRRLSEKESWEFIGTAVNSPFDDHDTEANWQYYVRGVKHNREVGIPAIVSISQTLRDSK